MRFFLLAICVFCVACDSTSPYQPIHASDLSGTYTVDLSSDGSVNHRVSCGRFSLSVTAQSRSWAPISPCTSAAGFPPTAGAVTVTGDTIQLAVVYGSGPSGTSYIRLYNLAAKSNAVRSKWDSDITCEGIGSGPLGCQIEYGTAQWSR